MLGDTLWGRRRHAITVGPQEALSVKDVGRILAFFVSDGKGHDRPAVVLITSGKTYSRGEFHFHGVLIDEPPEFTEFGVALVKVTGEFTRIQGEES